MRWIQFFIQKFFFRFNSLKICIFVYIEKNLSIWINISSNVTSRFPFNFSFYFVSSNTSSITIIASIQRVRVLATTENFASYYILNITSHFHWVKQPCKECRIFFELNIVPCCSVLWRKNEYELKIFFPFRFSLTLLYFISRKKINYRKKKPFRLNQFNPYLQY